MFRSLLSLVLTVVFLALAGCAGCGSEVVVPCSSDAECSAGARCISGKCQGSGGSGGFGGSGGSGGSGGGSTIVTGCNPSDPNNTTKDTDCDGLTDSEEYTISYNGNAHTDPCNSDSDMDGLADGVEMGRTTTVNTTCGTKFVPDTEPDSKTDPTVADSDGDTLNDGAEDKNRNGKVDPGESNPNKRDSDCDGVADNTEVSGSMGCMTDPLKLDTDDDGLPDGLEQGLQMPGADPGMPPLHCVYGGILFDTDPAVKTSACGKDTDGDGIQDGAEDANQNGKVDLGELDPNLASDGMGPAQNACAVSSLKPIQFHVAGGADIQIALVPEFTEVVRVSDGMGDRGLLFYDSVHQVGGLVIDDQRMPPAANATAEETYARGILQSVGAISTPAAQTFTTWDGFTQSVRSSYDQAGTADLKARVNAIAQAFSVMGTLPGTAGATGPFKIQAEYVRRAATRSIILIAITPAAGFTGQRLFTLDDVGGGSALAQFGDYAGVTCEVFDSTINAKVDFLWVVDNSGSMEASQTAVGNAGTAFSTKLATAGLDWRVAAVTTDGVTRAFTADGNLMRRWFTRNDALWFGIGGSGNEMTFSPTMSHVQSTLLPRTMDATQNKIRDGAALHIISLTDTNDHSSTTTPAFINFLNNFDNAGAKAVMHGIICPEGVQCSTQEETVANPAKIHEAIRASGGVVGDIQVANAAGMQAQLNGYIDAILSAAIAGTGRQLGRPPISATIKVAMEPNSTRGACNTADVPRDRVNGFDYDAATRRIVFLGNCIPNAAGRKIAVSYRFWVDGSPDPGGDPCNNTCVAPKACQPSSAMCVCPQNCGGACTGTTTCDMASCTCSPGIG